MRVCVCQTDRKGYDQSEGQEERGREEEEEQASRKLEGYLPLPLLIARPYLTTKAHVAHNAV